MLHAFRLSDWDTPAPPSPSRVSGRWHRAGEWVAHYWCLHPHTPWAELLRAEGINDVEDAQLVRRRLWAGRILDLVPREVTFEAADGLGVTAADLVSEDWTACQQLAERLIDQDVTAIVAPSAALPGTMNLVLFGDRVLTTWDAPAFEGFDSSYEIPAAVVAEHAQGQAELLPLVRHRGTPHPGLEAWREGDDFLYEQPWAPRRPM